jgi:pimeloyl-ACP methyl ester carboxylesterase
MKAILLLFVILNFKNTLEQEYDEVLELIERSGYEGKFSEVQTEDGYILGVHKINSRHKNTKKFPVFLMHGFLTTPISFFISTTKNSLPFMLADSGYDVFMGSRRGTKFSTKHRNFSTESKEFWNFTWHQIGFYDLKAMIDFTLSTTNTSKCFYVGYSQANTELLVLLSSRTEYNKKIIQAHMMSIAAALPNIHELGKFLSPLVINYAKSHDDFLYINMKSFIPFQVQLAKMLCNSFVPLRVEICKNIIFFMVGRNRRSTEINPNIYAVMFKNLSPRVGFKQLLHYAQTIMTGKFQQFDYGIEKNLAVYNNKNPPVYDLAKIIAPIYFYVGEEDVIFHRKVRR